MNLKVFSLIVLCCCCASAQAIIIDNGGPGTSYTGTWAASDATNWYGTNSIWARDGATYTWSFIPSNTGSYSIKMWWTQWSSRSSNIPVDIKTGNNTSRVYINQQINGGKWNSIGTFSLTAGVTCSVTIISQPSPTSTCADAVEFTYTGGGGGGEGSSGLVIDNGSSGTSYTGTWAASDATNWYGTNSIWARDGATYTWSFIPANTGSYGIQMWWTEWPSRSTNIPIDIKYGSNTSRFYVNQQINGGKWNSIGTYSLTAGVKCSVTIISQPSPTSTCADAVQFIYSGDGGGGGGSLPGEHIYVALVYNPDNPTSQFISMLRGMGAVQQDDVWVYRNSSLGKTFNVHILQNIEELRQAFMTDGAHVIVCGHSNYGLGPVFATATEITNQKITNVYYINDKRVLSISSPWVAIDVKDFKLFQAYPNWWPKFSDGSSGVMPYTYNDPRGNPPYDYYITYRVPGDSTYYKIETAHHSAIRKFPDCGKSAWYSATGSTPNPNNSSDRQYFITNPYPWSNYYTKPHYLAKTIIFRREPAITPSQMKYKRLFYESCGSGHYFADTFNRGMFFYGVGSVYGNNFITYLREYLRGRSDSQIWQALQSIEESYDYYDFAKLPPTLRQSEIEQAGTSQITMASVPQEIDEEMQARIEQLNDLSVQEIFETLRGPDFMGDDALTTYAISESLEDKKDEAIAMAMDYMQYPINQTIDGIVVSGSKDFYVSKKILKVFAEQAIDQLLELYYSEDPAVRANFARVAGELSYIDPIRELLMEALDDKETCEQSTIEMVGEPLRVCDVSYNQLVLHDEIRNVLRSIGTGLSYEDRDYQIEVLKEKLQPQ